jgi:nitrate reductase NapD
MADTPPPSDPDRREFLIGRRSAPRADASSGAAEIASVLVRAKPERLDDVAQAIAALPCTQIYGREPAGKLVVVIEASDVGAIGTILNTISSLPGVLTAALVFHATDEG